MIRVEKKLFLKSISIGIASLFLVSCGGGGGGTPASNDNDQQVVVPPAKFKGVASISATLGSSDKEGVAVLKLDIDGDGKYDGKEDTRLSVKSKDGSFTFAKIDTLNGKELKGQLIVSVDGYAPYQQVLTIADKDTLSIDASGAISKPALKEVVSLASLSPSARMGSVIEFGINNNGGKLQSFSRLISLSQLKAEADLPISDDRVSSYTFATASIPTDVQTVEATMQTFDSTKPEDMKNFPGTFTGYGLNGSKSATGDEVGLESAAFDLLVLKDQNGEEIKLVSNTSKLTQKVDLSTCTNKWTRYITSEQASVIEEWGDSDSNDDGFQVPIWSNDNSENAWKYIGVANYTSGSSAKFEMCIPDDWGSGYLNCDSPITFAKPTLMCINTLDQTDNPLSGISVNGRTTSGQYGYGYTNSDGHTSIAITDSDISKWSFTYSGALTGWNYIDVNLIDNPIVNVNSAECTYELNITNITNIYTHEIKVTAKNRDGSLASSAYVYLYHNGYGSHYYYKSGTTDDNGEVVFKVEAGVSYKASYGAGSADVKIDGNVVSPETADNNNYADVTVQDANVAPEGYIYLSRHTINKEITTTMPISISGYDRNPDTLSLTSLKIDGVDVTIDNPNESISPYYYYNSGSINISSLSVATHTVTAVISDGTDSVTLTKTFEVKGNLPPVISTPISAISNGTVYYIEKSGSTIKPNSYIFSANVYDPDGDSFTSTITLDSVEVNGTEQNLTIGNHTIVINATEKDTATKQTSTETINFTVANLKPIITQAGVTPNMVNIHNNSTAVITIYAYVSDPDGDNIASVIATDKTTNQEYNLSNNGSGSYYTKVIEANTIGVSDNHKFTIIALDDATPPLQSDGKDVSVSIRSFNVPPTFTKSLSQQSIALDTTINLNVIATDTEGSRLSFVWKVDNIVNNSATAGTTGEERLTLSGLSLGDHTISCTVSDVDGGVATTSATITVYDPTKTSPLTIKTGVPNLVVTLHNSADNLKMIDSKTTDSNGDAIFNVTGTTASFSIAFDPNSVITESELWTEVQSQVLNTAQNNCYNDTNTTIQALCTNADWCTISTDTTIPTWLFTLSKIKDKNDNNISGESIDTDNNGNISSSELYAGALANLDKDSDGSLSWAEMNRASVSVSIYKDVPIGSYDINFYTHDSYVSDNYFCQNDTSTNSFDVNLTNASNISYLNVNGSGYGSYYNYDYYNNSSLSTIGAKVNINYTDNEGKYDFLIKVTDTNQTDYIELLLDQTLADLKGSTQTYDALALTPATYMDVNITQDVNDSNLYVYGYYKGMNLVYSYGSYYDNTYKYYHNTLFDYIVSASQYGTNGLYYYQTNYQDDTTLKSSYKASDYPMLDVTIAVDANKTVTFGGSELAKVDYSSMGINIHDIASYSNYFELNIYSFANPTASFSFEDINLSLVLPSNILEQIDTTNPNITQYISASVTEIKNKTMQEIIDNFMQYSYYYNSTEPMRSVSYNLYQSNPIYKIVGKPAPKKVEPKRPTNPFSYKIDINKLFN